MAETTREVAERIAEKFRPRFVRMPADSQELLVAIESALNAERERCAKIAEEAGTTFYVLRQKEHSPYDPKDLIFGQDVCDKIAAAIRGKH